MGLQTQLDAKSGPFAQNVQAMQTLVNDLKQKICLLYTSPSPRD